MSLVLNNGPRKHRITIGRMLFAFFTTLPFLFFLIWRGGGGGEGGNIRRVTV